MKKLLNIFEMRKLLILVVFVPLLIACNNDTECRQERYVAMGIKLFQTKFDANEEAYVVSDFTPDSITIYGVDNDSILYYKKQNNVFDLPLRKTEPISRFVLYANGYYDTITVFHENTDNYLSMECGCVVFANIKAVVPTNNRIDSAIIRIPEVVNVSATHVELYYKAD
ncbi:MAG: DUF6452 family protein [Paludibacteraceae bacterium]